jgi:hypothetical protein
MPAPKHPNTTQATRRAAEKRVRQGEETAAAKLRAKGWTVTPPEDSQEDAMTTYTVEIDASNTSGTIWQALAPAENVTDSGTAEDVARWTAANQTLADGTGWRVRVWEGADADTGTRPAAEHYAGEEDSH